MVEIQNADNLSVEATADRLEDKIESGEIEGFTEPDFEALGEYFEDVSIEMNEAGGTCPVS